MNKWWKKLDFWVVLLMAVIYGGTMSYLSIVRHNAFASSYDLANMDQTVWNTAYGHFFQLSGSGGVVSRFNYHADLILILLAPLYWIWDSAKVLLIVQSVFIGMAAIPAWLLAKKILKNSLIALAIAGMLLINPTVIWANMYDFHGVTLAIFGLLWAIYFGLNKRWKWMWLAVFFSLISKEEVSLFIAIWGMGLWLIKERKQGILLMITGGLWFGLMVAIIIPHYSTTHEHWAWGWYKTSEGVKLYMATKWQQFIEYLGKIMAPWGWMPVIGLPWIILAGPEIAINVLSSQGQMRGTVMHYESVIMPALVTGTIFGLKYIGAIADKFRKGWGRYVQILVTAVLVVNVVRLNYFYSPLPTTPAHWKLMYRIEKEEIEFEKVLQKIPKDASITASSEVRTHLTHRINAYNLPDMVGKTDYIAMVDQNRIVGDYEPKEFETGLIEKLKTDKNYILVSNLGHFWLYQRIK